MEKCSSNVVVYQNHLEDLLSKLLEPFLQFLILLGLEWSVTLEFVNNYHMMHLQVVQDIYFENLELPDYS
jgi:hypothetical protein